MDINTIYSKIFPIGGIDDNNKYANLTGDEIGSVQLVEPALSVDEFVVAKKDLYDINNIPYKYAYNIPLIAIDNYRINQIDICAFTLDYTGFLPGLMFEFVDSSNTLLSTGIPRDGTIISIYVGGNGDELYYKPIRQDFVLTSIRKIGGGGQNMGGVLKYRVYGKLNVPYGYRKESWCSGKSTAMQALFNLAVWTGLGFSTNFSNTNTLDKMTWRNNETGTYFDFMEDITAHACYSPNTFFTSFIDQYNVLNFVECHSLLSHGGLKTDVPAMIYRASPPSSLPQYDPNTEKNTFNQLPLNKNDDPLNNVYQRLSYYFLTNHIHFNGWTNYISEYHEISNGGYLLSDGFKTHSIYSANNRRYNFVIRPIDNLKRNSATQRIESIPDEPTQESYIPLNLASISKKEYLSSDSNIDDITSVESFHNFGEVDTSNVFEQYYFAEVQNSYQMKCLKKCGLQVKLQNYNPSITKFSRIWIDIYDNHPISTTQIKKEKNTVDNKTNYSEYVDRKNEDILSFENEGKIEDIEKNGVAYMPWSQYEYNRSLSGWYVVTSIEIVYNPKESNLNMNLILNRIEYQPCFKNEYYATKKAIDKYKDDNNIENILNIETIK